MEKTISFSFVKDAPPKAGFFARLGQLLGLDRPLHSEKELVTVVQSRVGTEVINRLSEEGLTSKELSMVLPPRTLSHRKARREPLSLDETEKAVRIARLVALAEDVFGSKGKALGWLRKPLRRFDGAAPMAMMASEAGGRLVEEALIQIEEGYSA